MEPDISHWPPIIQYLFMIGAGIAGIGAWMLGRKGKGDSQDPVEELKKDFMAAIESQRTSLYARMDQLQVSLSSQVRDFDTRMSERFDHYDTRLRTAEDMTSRHDERIKTLFDLSRGRGKSQS